MVYILSLLCLCIDNKFVHTDCEERRLTFLSSYGQVLHFMMAERDSRIFSSIEEKSIHKICVYIYSCVVRIVQIKNYLIKTQWTMSQKLI